MFLNDWIDSQVQTGNASVLLGGVSVVAYNQASYDRAARQIWNQVHYGTDYSGGGGYSNAVSQSYGRGGSGGKHSVSANVSASAAIANNMANIVGIACAFISSTFALPGLAIGVAIGGTIYGIASVCGLSTTIDKATNHWGRNMFYGKKEEE